MLIFNLESKIFQVLKVKNRFNYFKYYSMKKSKLFLLGSTRKLFIYFNCFILVFFCNELKSFGQSRIEQLVEGREFKNSETGLIIQYGYISTWNTYGVTFRNKNGVKFYYINCTKSVASDQESMVLTQCRDLDDKSAGKIYIFPRKIIQVYPDGRFVFDIVEDDKISYNRSSKANNSLF